MLSGLWSPSSGQAWPCGISAFKNLAPSVSLVFGYNCWVTLAGLPGHWIEGDG